MIKKAYIKYFALNIIKARKFHTDKIASFFTMEGRKQRKQIEKKREDYKAAKNTS